MWATRPQTAFVIGLVAWAVSGSAAYGQAACTTNGCDGVGAGDFGYVNRSECGWCLRRVAAGGTCDNLTDPPQQCANLLQAPLSLDAVEVHLCELNIFLDGDIGDAVAAGATKLVDQILDDNDVIPGPFGDADEPRINGDPNGMNVGSSGILYVPDQDPGDGVDDSFLYVAWDISDMATDGVAPAPYDADDDGSACRVAPELVGTVDDNQADGYTMELQICANLGDYDPGHVDGGPTINIGNNFDLFVQSLMLPHPPPFGLFVDTSLPTVASMFPTADFVTNRTSGCIDRERRLCGRSPDGNNVEMVIKRVESIAAFGTATGDLDGDGDLDAQDHVLARRFNLTQLVARLGGSSSGDGGDEEYASLAVRTSLPSIEVSKQVRCADSATTGFASTVDAIPGSIVEYRIVIRNTGNETLDVTVDDVMRGVGTQGDLVTCDPLCGTLSAELTTNGVTTPIDLKFPPANLDVNFFFDSCELPDGGFLGAIRNNEAIRLGLLDGAQVSRADRTCLLVPGDSIAIRFQAISSNGVGFCSQFDDPDCANAVSVTAFAVPPLAITNGTTCGFSEACNDGLFCNGEETCQAAFCVQGVEPCSGLLPHCNELKDTCEPPFADSSGVADTSAETAPGAAGDDNIATVNLLCREFDFVKEVGFPADTNSFVTGTDKLQFPPVSTRATVSVEFRLGGFNHGELPEDITISDPQLCTDLAAVGAILDDCDLCALDATPGEITINVPAGAAYSTSCVVTFPQQQDLYDFVELDNDRPDCRAEQDSCYRNCASATANAVLGETCGPADAITTNSFATICSDQCDVEVLKEVRCLPNCSTAGLDPDEGWIDASTTGHPLPVLPGACLEYRITTTNLGDTEICEIRYTDALSPTSAFSGGPAVTSQSPVNYCPNLPADFNWDGTPVRCQLTDALPPNGSHVFTFMGTLDLGASAILDPVNNIRAEAASYCVNPADVFYECDDISSVGVDIRACGLEVTKEVTCDDPAEASAQFELDDIAEAVPGSTIGFSILVCNTGELNLSSLSLTDTLTCSNWYLPNSVTATVNGTDVTSCICATDHCPTFAELSGDKNLDMAGCLPGGIPTNGCLTVSFEVLVPADFAGAGTALDCENTFRAAGFSEVCAGPDATTCGVDIDTAGIDVRIPAVECDKEVCVDTNCDGTCDAPFTTDLQLPCDVIYPLCLIYRGTVTNIGETSLVGVQVCDEALIADAAAAGLNVGPCQLGAGDGCSTPAALDINSSAVALCRVEVPSHAAWAAFAGRDGGDESCYANQMSADGGAPMNAYCVRGSEGLDAATCSANVCIAPPCEISVMKGVRCIDGCLTRSTVGSPSFRDSPAGDCDGNGVMDLRDFVHLTDCIGGPMAMPDPLVGAMTMNACLAAFDIDGDHDVDMRDCALFETLAGLPVDSLPVTPGATVEFEIKVTNEGDEPICTLEFSDILTNGAELCVNATTSIEFVSSSGLSTACTPPLPGWFKGDGTPFYFDIPASCSGLLLQPGDMLLIHVGAEIDDNASGIIRNDVCVRCDPIDGSACVAPAAYCGDQVCDEAVVPVQECEFSVEKEVACGEPRDDDGAVNTNALFETQVNVLPASTNGFLITICNTGDAELSTIGISEILDCGGWYVTNSVHATVGDIDVTDCLCGTNGCASVDDLDGDHSLDPCLGHGLSAGECLNITFEVRPPSCPDPNLAVDCTNVVIVEGHTDLCSPDTNPCGLPQTAQATIDVRCPGIACDKLVCADVNTNGSCLDAGDFALAHALLLPCDIHFPFDLIYEITVTNTGDIPLVGVQVCDADLLANAAAAGLDAGPCDLCVGSCTAGGDDGCGGLVDLNPSATATARCTIRVPNAAAWLAFSELDVNTNGGCYTNEATANGAADSRFICTDDVDGGVTSHCSAEVCLEPKCTPVITCPPDRVIDCTDTNGPPFTGVAEVDHNCDVEPVLDYSDTTTNGDCPQEYVIKRTWTADAECDAHDECVQVLTVVDTNGPTITCPPDLYFECEAGSTGVATAIDDCDLLPDVSYEDLVSGTCPTDTARIWTAVDDCGNSNSCTQHIVVDDTQPPVFEFCPGDIRISCEDPVPPCDTNGVRVVDSCGFVAVDCADTPQPGTCPMIIEREYTATDVCGNVSTCGHRIYIDDEEPPVIICPPDFSISCDEPLPDCTTDGVIAVDSCGLVRVECMGDQPLPGICPEKVLRKYRAIDDCLNVSTCGQIITLVDKLPPEPICPPDETIDCTEPIPPVDTNSVSAIDSCGLYTVDHAGDFPDGELCPLTIRREYVVRDSCGNVSTCGQLITVVDTNGPEIVCPPDLLFECEMGSTGVPVVQDDCDPNPIVSFDDLTTNACPEVTARVWTAVDRCGNRNSCTQIISVDDTKPPVFEECPDDIRLNCEEDVPPCDTNAVVVVDSCGFVVVTCADTPVPGACPTIIEREYTATDVCGNVSTCGHRIIRDDDEPPVIICPPAIEHDCDKPLPDCTTAGVFAVDSCGLVAVECMGDVPQPGTCPEKVLRKYRAMDDCGNVSTCGQMISIVDDEPPAFEDCPDDIAIDCTDPVPPCDTNGVGAVDSCGLVNVDCRDVTLPETCPTIIEREYIATDECGNASTCGHTITIYDDEPPMLTCPPTVTLECDQPIPPCNTNSVTAIDSCGVVYVDCLGDSSDGETCPETIVRKYAARDACGNVTTCGQLIVRDDTLPPTIDCPDDQNCTCEPIWRVIDFETDGNSNALPAGYRFNGYLPGLGVSVLTNNAVAGHPDLAIIFDSANPTGDDPDLRTPGYHPTNTVAYGKVLIIAENAVDTSPPDTLVDDPDDEGGRPAGWIDMTFDDTYAAAEIVICDTDEAENTGTIQFFQGAVQVGTRSIAVLGDNSIQTIAFAGAEFNHIRVNVPGSGSIPEIRLRTLCDPTCVPEDPIVDDNCDPDPEVTCVEHVSTGGFGGSEYSWTWEPGEPNVWYVNTAGKWEALSATYNSVTHRMTFDTTFGDQVTEGMTIVINNGPMPDQLNAVWAMFYFDGNVPANPILTVYTYNGRADRTSWTDGDPYTSGNQGGDLIVSSLLDTSWINSLTVTDVGGKRKYHMDIDATPILAHVPQWPNQDGEPWKGTGFDGGIGMWLGSFKFLTTAYASGRLTQWQFPPDGYLDTGHMLTDVECSPSEIIRCCTATDDCGNSAECCHRLIIADCASCDCSTNGDTTPPALNCPPSVTLDCGDSTDPGDTGVATASDDCDSFVSVWFEDSTDRDTVITRTWHAKDQCDNESICQQILTVGDYNNKIVFNENFDGYVYFPDQHPAGDPINVGLPVQTEGAREKWYGGRFATPDGGTIDSDLAVQKYGGDGNSTPVGRVADDAGLLMRIDTRIFTYARVEFDWRMFDVGSGDKFVVGYYVGELDFGGDTPDGENDNMVHNFSLDGPQWAQWTELLRSNKTTWQKNVTFDLPVGHKDVWIAFWVDNGHGDFAKIDNIEVRAFCP